MFNEWEEELKKPASDSTYIVEKYGERPDLEEWKKRQETQLVQGMLELYNGAAYFIYSLIC